MEPRSSLPRSQEPAIFYSLSDEQEWKCVLVRVHNMTFLEMVAFCLGENNQMHVLRNNKNRKMFN
jgi:hypothetical protein